MDIKFSWTQSYTEKSQRTTKKTSVKLCAFFVQLRVITRDYAEIFLINMD